VQAEPIAAGQAPDQALVAALAGGDAAALRVLYDRYGGMVFTLSTRLLFGDRGAAEEVVQDVFVRCWSRAETYRPERGSVPGWLLGMTRNRVIDVLRRRRSQLINGAPFLSIDGLDGRLDSMDSTATHAAQEIVDWGINDAVASLPPEQRMVVVLTLYGEFTHRQIAEELGLPLGTVKSRVRRGMERLRQRLGIAEHDRA
jgi:RNA polymerase sigma-70 factor (ECF subfamily)